MTDEHYIVSWDGQDCFLEDCRTSVSALATTDDHPPVRMTLSAARIEIVDGFLARGRVEEAGRLVGLSDVAFLAEWALKPAPESED